MFVYKELYLYYWEQFLVYNFLNIHFMIKFLFFPIFVSMMFSSCVLGTSFPKSSQNTGTTVVPVPSKPDSIISPSQVTGTATHPEIPSSAPDTDATNGDILPESPASDVVTPINSIDSPKDILPEKE